MIEDAEIMSLEAQDKQIARMQSAAYKIVTHKASELPSEYNALIFSRWLRSLRFGNPLFKQIDSDEFYKQYHKYLENLLAKPDTLVRLAVLPEDEHGPEVVIGFSVSREDVLDYVHVQKDARRKGVAKALTQFKYNAISHITLTAMQICERSLKDKSLKFNPFA